MAIGKIIGKVLSNVPSVKSVAEKRVAGNTSKVESAVAARSNSVAKKVNIALDYGRKILALPEGQVTTRSGRSYTRTMGQNGQRVYADASGTQTIFNGIYYQRPGYHESAIFRTTPDGGHYSLKHSTGTSRYNRGEQEVTLWTREKTGGDCKTTVIDINPESKITQTHYDNYNGADNTITGIETRYGCPIPFDNSGVYGWLNQRGVVEKQPLWTSLRDYLK